MRVEPILPALPEVANLHLRPIEDELFAPLGLATLAAYLPPDWEVDMQDEHVEKLHLHDEPHLIIIQAYSTNDYRTCALADHYRARGAYVCLHATSPSEEAAPPSDSIFLGLSEETFPQFFGTGNPGRAACRGPGARWWACRLSGDTLSSASAIWCPTR